MNFSLKIKNLVLICLIYFGFQSFFNAQNATTFKTGADQPEVYLPLLKNKKVIVLTNQTGVLSDSKHTHLVDFLISKKVNITKIFTPEHGFRGNADAGEHVKSDIDKQTGLPIVSLYGNNKKPKPEQISDSDIILFDLQDVGVRFYTYISTLTYVMEAAAEAGKEVIVLDRPNPHDGYTDGPVLNKKWTSFVGMHEIPVIYGLTIGEYGNMVNGEGWLKNNIKAKYTVVKMANYHKKQRYGILEKPSPNLPNDKAINFYPSLCFFEGANISLGRGTEFPFQAYGSPYTKDFSFKFTPKPSYGSKNPPLNGQECFGEDLRNYPETLTGINLEWLIKAYKDYKSPAGKGDFFLKNLFFDTLAGSDQLRKQIISGLSQEQIKASWKKGLEDFEKTRQKYVVYPN
ncbi:exo-beta-N-acetylmuramidase NamZ domain-containing protein [Elizabethkingia anophelis]|uniref:exo-beta-N-acetylmuramidase NamZ family protein n=1 Tax=Elizabethkingia anophelis TaxID=1117645 RepID=UPI003787077A